MNTSASTDRLDYLDALRAFALLLGIFFHAALSFSPAYIGWAVMDISTSPLVSVFMLISHSFRMELFFLIAGFFSHMTFHKKGGIPFMRSRLTRIAIPFLVAWFILRPLIVSGWVMGAQSLAGDVEILNGLKLGFLSLSDLPHGILSGTHLWFLYYLLLTTTALLVFRALIAKSKSIQLTITSNIDKFTVWLTHSRFALLTLAIPTAICLNFMNHWGMDTPDQSLVPHVPVFLIYFAFFGLGWILHRQEGAIDTLSKPTIARTSICVTSIAGAVILSDYQSDLSHPYAHFIKAAFSLCYAFMMWTLVILSIGTFKRILDRSNRIVRYIADASYWLYLVHLPIVVWLQIAFAEIEIHWTLKLSAIFGLTFAISLLTYDLFVRSTFIGATLNGRKKKRTLFPS